MSTENESHDRWRGIGRQIFFGALLATAAVVVIEAASWTDGWRTSVSADGDNGTRVKISHRRDRLVAELRGEIEFLPDESGIARMGPNAYFEIAERRDGERRRLEATPGAGGVPELRYRVGRKDAELDAAAREWLRQALPRVFRASGLDAEARVGRILAHSGVGGVLAEIEAIRGDHVERLYGQQLLEQAALEPGELGRLLEIAGDEISSDYELRRLLAGIPAASLVPEVLPAYAAAVASIGSDYELRQTLTALLHSDGFGRAHLAALLNAAATIAGDYALAELLIEVAQTAAGGEPLPGELPAAVRTIGGDYELRRVLDAFFRQPELPAESFDALLEVTSSIGGDYELAEILVTVPELYPQGRELPGAYFEALSTLGSDHELGRAANAALERPGLGHGELVRLLDAARSIGSNNQLAELLLELARRGLVDDELRPEVERTLGTIGSSHERERVREALGGAG